MMRHSLIILFQAMAALIISGCNDTSAKPKSTSPNYPELIYEAGSAELCLVRFDFSYENVADTEKTFTEIADKFANIILPQTGKLFKIDLLMQSHFFALADKPATGCNATYAFFDDAMLHAARGSGIQPQQAISPASGDFNVPVVKWTSRPVTAAQTNGGLAFWSHEKLKQDWPGLAFDKPAFRTSCGITIIPEENEAVTTSWIERLVSYHNSRTSFGILHLQKSQDGSRITFLYSGKCENLDAQTRAVIRWLQQVSGNVWSAKYRLEQNR